jgi:proline iminopeptidase
MGSLALAVLLAACTTPLRPPTPREGRVPVGKASLYFREIGQGQPMLVLHGGPDFDHGYLVPELDRLADSFRLIYYDQRGRGRSAAGVRPEDVSLETEMEDLDSVLRHFGLGSAALLGHSWGSVLALEYALRHPERVSHLVLLNPAPASKDDFTLLRKERRERWPEDVERLRAIAATDGYKQGDPDTVAAYYRVHFNAALARPEDHTLLLARFRASFTREGILKARAVEDRLLDQTWLSSQYDLHPKLATLRIPTLVVYGDHEFIPAACAAHIAGSIPKARLVTLKECGHFSYLECPDAVGKQIRALFRTP